MSGSMRAWVALVAGGAAGLPFIAQPLFSFLLPLCLVPLVRVAASVARPGVSIASMWVQGYLASIGQVLVVFYWLPRLQSDQLVYEWIMWPALALTALYLGLFGAMAITLAASLAARGALPLMWSLPAAWTLFEWLRTQGTLGFPWGTCGYGLWAAPILFQSVDLWGIFGLSFLTLAIALRLALPTARRLAEAAVIASLLVAYGTHRLTEPEPDEAIDVALIQPNWSPAEKWASENRARVFARYVEQSLRAVPDSADLLVWPETATPFRLMDSPTHVARVQRLADRRRTAIIAGTVHREIGDSLRPAVHRNAAVLFVPGSTERKVYSKRYLVPFSEWLPWRFLRIMEINFGQADFTPGTDAAPFRFGDHAAAMLICIEAILPRYARASVREGADLLVNITNDVWFGEGPAPRHHADMARFRSAELRRPMVRCANTGISMLVDRNGRAEKQIGTFRQGVLRGVLHPERSTTPYAALGDWPVTACALLLLAGALEAWRRRSARR